MNQASFLDIGPWRNQWKYLRLYVCVCVRWLSGKESACKKTKYLPAMQESRVQSLGREDPLEKGMETHSSILAWRIPWIEPGGLHSMGSQLRHN